MPALFVFLLKVNIALLLFCAGYYLVLRHLTFYTLNRIYLVAAIFFASVYPLINLNNFAEHHQQLSSRVQVVVLNFKAPAEALVKPLAQPGYWSWIALLFWLVAVTLGIRLLMQLFSLYKLHRASIPMKIKEHSVRVMHGDAGPFSFWKSIYVNPANHNDNELKAILEHEQVHVNEWHTLDILLAEISTIFYWFNPGVWLMKKAVRENVEFITDRKILRKGFDSKQYQYSLVNVSFAASPQSIVNHFNISTIKKRIIMMNAKESSKFNLTRYAFLIPLVVICLLTFSFSKAELIRDSKKSYKALTSSVTKINLVKAADEKIKKMGASVLNYVIKLRDTTMAKDTNKTKSQIKMYYALNYYVTDSTKKHHDTAATKHFNLSYSFTTDTNQKKQLKKLAEDNQSIFVIDGKVVKTDALININPDIILSITIDKSGPDGKGVVYVNTKNSPRVLNITTARINGRPLKVMNEKMINGSPAIVDTVKIDGKVKIAYGHAVLDTIYIARSMGYTTRPMAMQNYKVVTGYSVKDSVNHHILLNKMSGLTVTKNGSVLKIDTANNKKMVTMNLMMNNLTRALADSRKLKSNIDNLSGKLIFIDGKEATSRDMKKLSAADIKSMSAEAGDEVVKKYGDKAKDGVLFITTKKDK